MSLLFKVAPFVVAASAFAASAAQAQYYSSARPQQPPPLYPYQQQPGINTSRPFAVEVAPGQYVIHRPEEMRASRKPRHAAPAPVAKPVAKPVRVKTKTDPALVEELRQRAAGQKPAKSSAKPDSVIHTTKRVRLKPKVVETTRYVDVPPRVVDQYTVVDDATGQKKVLIEAPGADVPLVKSGKPEKADGKKRVIQADAEITVLGPDRMTIQLYRKGERGKNARIN